MSDERRRSTDFVSWGRILRSLALSTPLTIPSIYAGGKALLDFHEEWVERGKKAELVEPLREQVNDLQDRLERLERWQCVLGWNPPETRDAGRCRGEH